MTRYFIRDTAGFLARLGPFGASVFVGSTFRSYSVWFRSRQFGWQTSQFGGRKTGFFTQRYIAG